MYKIKQWVNIMNIYKTRNEYAKLNWIHLNTANQRYKRWRLIECNSRWKKVWYIDIIETNKFLADKIKEIWK